MCSKVDSKLSLLRKSLITLRTLKSFLSCMYSKVDSKLRLLRKSFITMGTSDKAFLHCMCSYMFNKGTTWWEKPLSHWEHLKGFSPVCVLRWQVRLILLRKSFITIGTLMRHSLLYAFLDDRIRSLWWEKLLLHWEHLKVFLSCMCSKVESKLILLRKSLITLGNI